MHASVSQLPETFCFNCIQFLFFLSTFNHFRIKMKEEYHKFYTNYLSREFELLVFGHAGYPVILFPTSKGKYYDAKDFKLIEAASSLIDTGKIKIYCPDSVDTESWYNYDIQPADRVKTHIGYENVILNDVIEFVKYETGRTKVGVAGCGFGGYHAANIAFRHPDKIGYLISMSGEFDIKKFIMGYYDDDCYYNNPPDYLPGLKDYYILQEIKSMGIVLSTGVHDFSLDENVRLSNILNEKGINHWLDVVPGGRHDWHWWKESFPKYLSRVES